MTPSSLCTCTVEEHCVTMTITIPVIVSVEVTRESAIGTVVPAKTFTKLTGCTPYNIPDSDDLRAYLTEDDRSQAFNAAIAHAPHKTNSTTPNFVEEQP
jgi:hypothetical protein